MRKRITALLLAGALALGLLPAPILAAHHRAVPRRFHRQP